MSSNPKPLTTTALSAGVLILGIPLAIAALLIQRVDMPTPDLGHEEIKSGPDDKITLKPLNFVSGPNEAVTAGSAISIVASLLLVAALIVTRHYKKHHIWGWAVFIPAAANLVAQIGCLAAAFIMKGKNPEADNKDAVRYVNGKWETDGKLWTREGWACMMDKFYAEQEPWAKDACSGLRTGGMLTIALVATAVLMLGVAYFQLHRRGGFSWLFGKRRSVPEYGMQRKGESLDLEPKR